MSDSSEMSEVPALPRKRRRWRRWIALFIVVLLCGWFGHFAYLRITRRPTPRPEYWEAKLAELEPAPAGAIPWKQALQVLTNQPWRSTRPVGTRPAFTASRLLRGPWDQSRPDIAAATAAFTSGAFGKAHAELRRAAEAGWHNPISVSYGPDERVYGHYNSWRWILLAHSRWARESGGDMDTAADDWLTVLRMTRQLRRGQTAYACSWERIHNYWLTVEMILAARESPPPIDTRALCLEIDQFLGPMLGARDMLEGERFVHRHLLECFYVREGGDWIDLSEAVKCSGSPLGARPAKAPSRLWNLASFLFYDLATARAAVDMWFAPFEGCTDIVSCRRAREEIKSSHREPRVNALAGFWYHPSPGLLDAYTWVPIGYYVMRCSLDAALTMLALHEYQRRHHQYPETLDELMPVFLPRLPIDYADRKPLRYRRTDDSYVLYSIGLNGKDDGGKSRHDFPTNFEDENPDAVFTAVRRRELQQ